MIVCLQFRYSFFYRNIKMNALHSSFLLVCFCFCLEVSVAEKKKLQIGVKKKIENCTKRSKKGDVLKMHYTGKLEDGTEFDSSIPRGDPLTFTLGAGQVIKEAILQKRSEYKSFLEIRKNLEEKAYGSWLEKAGWDQGLLNMCEGEKRKLSIPPELGYGDNGAPPKIPGGATLIFEVELVKIERKSEL